MQDIFNALGFLSQYIHVGGWITLLAMAWKISWKFSKFLNKLLDSIDKGSSSADTVELLATNHFPHLQETMNNVLEEIRGLRRDLITAFLTRKD